MQEVQQEQQAAMQQQMAMQQQLVGQAGSLASSPLADPTKNPALMSGIENGGSNPEETLPPET